MSSQRNQRVFFLFGIFIALVGIITFLQTPKAQAAINPQINFQGKLTNTDGTNVTTGSYSIVFSLYTVSSGGSNVWTETQSSVSVTDGIFNVALGSVTSLPGSVDFNSTPLYLGVKVGADPEMTPRIQFTSSPYAFNSDKLDGLDGANFVQLAQGVQGDSSTTNPSIFINKTGATAKILELQRAGTDVFTINNDGSTYLQNSGNSASAFRIQDTSNNSVVNVNTSIGDVTLNVGNQYINGVTLTAAPTIAGFTSGGTLTTATNYYYIVSAVGPGGEGYGYPTTPRFYLTTNAASRVQVSWTAATGATSYKLYRSTDNLNWKFINAGNVVTYNDTSNAAWTVTGFPPDFSTTGNLYLQTGAGIQFNPSSTVFAQYSVAANALQLENGISGSGVSLTGDNINFYDTTGTNANLSINASGAINLKNRSNSVSAFTIQNVGNDTLLTANTSTNKITIGNSTGTDTATTLLVLDNATVDPTSNLLEGAMYYNSANDKFRCYQNSAWTDCIGAGGGGSDLQGAYAASSSPATITTTATAKGIIFKAGATFDSATLFQVQNAAGNTVLAVDSTGTTAAKLLTNNSGAESWVATTASTGGSLRTGFTTVMWNNKVYNWGGTTSEGGASAVMNTMDIYDPASNTWTTGAAGGTARYGQSGVVYNGKIYNWGGQIFGGTIINTIDIYDIANNTWSTGLAGGTARYEHNAVVYNGKIYNWGGFNSASTVINTVDIYDIAANSWSTGTAGGTARAKQSTVLYNGKMYNFGGLNQSTTTVYNTMDIYDIAGNSWSTGAAATQTRANQSAVTYNGKMYVYGGYAATTTASSFMNTTDIYDFASNTWSTGPNGIRNRSSQGAVVYNSKMYLFAGAENNNSTTNVDVFSFNSMTWNGPPNGLYGGSSGSAYSVVWNGKVYITGGAFMSIYDFNSNSWNSGVPCPTTRFNSNAVVYNGKIYAWGGAVTNLDIFDIASNTWSTGLAGGTARNNSTANLYNGKIYYWGGTDTGSVKLNTMDIYDIASNTWSTGLAGGTARTAHGGEVYKSKIYYFGGVNSVVPINNVDIYDIPTNTWSTGTTGGGATQGIRSVGYNGKIYNWGGTIAGGTKVNTLYIYDIATDSWSSGTAGGAARTSYGAALYNNKIYYIGGTNTANIGTLITDILDLGTQSAGLLVLGNGTNDPTGQSGGIYFNSDSDSLRCYSASIGWQNCNSNVSWQVGAGGNHFVQNSTGANVLNADSASSIVNIGSTTSDSTQILLTLDSFSTLADTASCSTTLNSGALYYNSNVGSNAVRACIGGAWEDLVSTAGAFFTFFGVVPDSGSNPGDLQSRTTANVTGPCKVSWASGTTVTVAPCTAYSGGRKVAVASTTVTLASQGTNTWHHICLTGTNSQPASSTGNATETTNLGTSSYPSAIGPVVCLADVKATTATTINAIYDTRVFTTTTKEFGYSAAALPLGVVVKPDTTNPNRLALPGITATGFIRGVVVASDGAAWASGGPNVIIATAGTVAIKATAGTPSITATVQNSTGTNGYVFTATAVGTATAPYQNIGIAQTTWASTCTAAATCALSLLTAVNLK